MLLEQEKTSTERFILLVHTIFDMLFDTVWHKELFELLGELDILGKDIRKYKTLRIQLLHADRNLFEKLPK